jgi:hypothetical protein
LIVLLTIRFPIFNLTSALKVDTLPWPGFRASNILTIGRAVRGDIAVTNPLRNPADRLLAKLSTLQFRHRGRQVPESKESRYSRAANACVIPLDDNNR